MTNRIETKWSVRDIQRAIVRYTGNDESIPNVSFGFFGRMECDLVQLSDSNRIHEFEIKRSWGDFLADFKKRHFHDDVRICRLTFVLPESFAGDRLRRFCAEHYQEFEREFDFLFYVEHGAVCHITDRHWEEKGYNGSHFVPEERYRTDTYITTDMLKVIRANDRAAQFRRGLFLEERAKLYRLGTIRLWHRHNETETENENTQED